MQVKIAKTYAWRNATNISKPVSATEKPRGNHPPSSPKLITKPPKTLSIVCPAIILANNLTDKLTGLLKYEIISIIVINGSNNVGTPLGTKSFKYPKPCFIKPMTVTATKIKIANSKVTIIWLVTVNEYGNIPTMLQKRTHINKLKIKGK